MNPRFAFALLLVSALLVAGCGGDDAPGTIPDTIPPLTPIVSGVDGTSSTVYIWWEPNTEPDLAGYFVYVTVKDETVLANYQATTLNYMYVEVEDKEVRLQVTAIDFSGNESGRSPSWRVQKDNPPRDDRGGTLEPPIG